VVETSIDAVIEGWVAGLSDGLSLSASTVQDRLFELWGMLDEGGVRREVERWLTETLDRHLYTSDELITRLRALNGVGSLNA
jgi:hypothetical protein